MGEDIRLIGRQELSNSCNSVTDDVVEQFARQATLPVLAVAEKRLGVSHVGKVIAVRTFHVNGWPAQIAAGYQTPHSAGRVCELIVVTSSDLESLSAGKRDERSSLIGVDRERLLHVYVTTVFETLRGNRRMALRRRGYMDDVWPYAVEQLPNVGEMAVDTKSLTKLPRHEQLSITSCDQLTARDPLNLGNVRIGDLAAADHGNFKHWPSSNDNSRNDASDRHAWQRVVSSRDGPSPWHLNSGCASILRAICED